MLILCDKCNKEFKECVTCNLLFHPYCGAQGSCQETVAEELIGPAECQSCKTQRCGVDTVTVLEALRVLEASIISHINTRVGSLEDAVDTLRVEMRSVGEKLAVSETERRDSFNKRCDKLEQLVDSVRAELKRELKEVCHQVETVCNGNAEVFKTPDQESFFSLIPKRKFPEYV